MFNKIKEKLKNIIQNIKLRRPLHLAIMAVSTLMFIAAGILIFSIANKTEAMAEPSAGRTNFMDISSVVAVAGIDDLAAAGNSASNNSWPGEIISSTISQIQPQREGVIKNWRVRIGDYVPQGKILGEISAPPATPELIIMLAEKSEALARATAQAALADEFAIKEQLRLSALKDSLGGKVILNTDLSFTALENMRKNAEAKQIAVRSFVERALTRHIAILSNIVDWRYFRSGSNVLYYKEFGALNQSVRNGYELAFVALVEKLKSSDELPVENAQKYFALLVQLANNSLDMNDGEMPMNEFKMAVNEDQKEFLEMLADYREAQAELSDKEAEYKIMISENGAMVEKDRAMAHAEVKAMEASYKTIANEITNGLYIVAPRAGVVSAIYKKAGDLVDPGMSIAVIAGQAKSDLVVRISIPNNIRKPSIGEIFSVVRPGFPTDARKIKITGIGASLDEMGSYMADAVFIDRVLWPAGSSVRVIVPENLNTQIIKLSSVWWSEDGISYVWGVSEAGRIFAKKITIGRTLGTAAGTSVEVYEGIKNGDRYIISPAPDIRENMLLDEIVKEENEAGGSAKSGKGDSMGGMEM